MNARIPNLVRVPSLLLAAALQILPLMRAALPVTQSTANVLVILLRWGGAAAASLGSIQAVSGGSGKITNPRNATATNGEPFSFRLTAGPHSAHYWEAAGLPEGLSLTGRPGTALWKIDGIPDVAGTFNVGLKAKDNPKSGGSRTLTATLVLTVLPGGTAAPTIYAPPSNQSALAGGDAMLSVLATGARPMSYQWRFNATDLPGGTNRSLVLAGVTDRDAGSYDVVAINSHGSVTSSVATLTITNAPVPVPIGVFNGLFVDTNDVSGESAGYVSVKTGPGRSYSGSLRLGLAKLPFKGAFDGEGHSATNITRTGAPALSVDLNLTGGSLTGRVSDGVWTSPLRADLAVFNAKTNPATTLAGLYTALLPGAEANTGAPEGDGVATLKVDPGGLLSFTATLADGTKVIQKSPLSASGDWPLYAPLYQGGGAVLGWWRVRPAGDIDLEGVIHWLRPAGPIPKVHTNGFHLRSDAMGSTFNPPGTNRLLEAPTATIAFRGGNLAASFTNDLALGPSGRVTNTSPNKLTLTFNAKSGLIAGVVTDPSSLKPVKYQAVVLQRQQIAGGAFLGTNEVGRVEIKP